MDDVVAADRMLALVTARDSSVEQPGFGDLYEIGVAALIHKMVRAPDGTLRILVQGLRRIRLVEPAGEDPYLIGRFEPVPEVVRESRELEALTRTVQNLFARVIGHVPYLPEELQLAAANVDDPNALANLVASTMRLKTEEKQHLLEIDDVEQRLREIASILNRELEVFELGSKIQSQVQSELDKGQREFFLRQQLKAIQDELGEADEHQAEINELRSRLAERDLPEEARKAAERELARLEKLPPAAAEYGVIRTYLEWILELPWDKTTKDNLDLRRARRILDEDHYDLERVKERIVEHLAVSKLKQDVSGPVLCFVGPPGVGKTSLGQSIARALGRKFARISVGGVRDEAEIRGHRRTYIGAMPGSIIRALRDAESKNPVFLIDEIDKMGADFRGDPASAMLEVLDPEQNSTFRDHYLDLPFDLSKVLFICTANQLDTIPLAAPRPHGRHPARGLHRGREAQDRAALPRAQAGRRARAHADAGDPHRGRAAARHPRVHARGGPARAGAPDRRALPQGGHADRAGPGEAPARGRAQGARLARPAPLRRRGAQAHVRRRAWRRGSRGRRSAATSSSSRRAPTRARAGCGSPASSSR